MDYSTTPKTIILTQPTARRRSLCVVTNPKVTIPMGCCIMGRSAVQTYQSNHRAASQTPNMQAHRDLSCFKDSKMNIVKSTLDTYYTACRLCDGEGIVDVPLPTSGYTITPEYEERTCTACDGRGELEITTVVKPDPDQRYRAAQRA